MKMVVLGDKKGIIKGFFIKSIFIIISMLLILKILAIMNDFLGLNYRSDHRNSSFVNSQAYENKNLKKGLEIGLKEYFSH